MNSTSAFSISLNPDIYARQSIFNSFVNEQIDPNMVFNILKTSNLIAFDSDRYKSGIGSLYPTEKELLQQYLNNYVPELNVMVSSFYLPKHKWGRIMPVDYLSMSVFHRPTRHSLCKNKYVDIDMVNCHFSIINQLMSAHNLNNKFIKMYCDDTKGIRLQIMEYFGCSKDSAKQLFIRIIYGGTFDKWKKDFKIVNKTNLKIIVEIENELNQFRQLVFDSNQHILNDILYVFPDKFKGKSQKQIVNSVVAFWCQTVERYLQEQAIIFISAEFNVPINETIPCQDGFMIPQKYFTIDMINQINNFIKESTGLNVEFIDKPFEESYYIRQSTEKFYPITLFDIQDSDFAESYASVCYGNKPIVTTGKDVLETYYYNGIYWTLSPLHNADLFKSNFDNLKHWYENMVNKRIKILNAYLDSNADSNPKKIKENQKANDKKIKDIYKDIIKLDKLKVKQCGQFTTNQLTEMDELNAMISLIESKDDNCNGLDMFERISNGIDCLIKSNYKTLGSNRRREDVVKIFKKDKFVPNIEWNNKKDLFVFEDCVYDLSIGDFQKPNQLDYMNLSCGNKYNIKMTGIEEAEKEIEKFFRSIVGCNADYEYLMKQMASFLKQENVEEKGYFWLGRGRNGKGTGSELIKNAIGLYWGNLSMEYFTSYSKDADKPNQNLYNCRNSRVLCSSEIGDSDSNNKAVSFMTAPFKAMTGGDPVYARELGTKNTSNFKAGKTLIQTNVMPSFSKIDTSLKERIVVVEFPYTFTDDEELLLKEPLKYKVKDISLKSKFSTPLYRTAMINILFKNYKEYKKSFVIPDSVKKYTNSYFAGQSIKSWIDENCDKNSDFNIDLETIKLLFKGDTGKFMNIKQIKDELIELGLIIKRNSNNGFNLKGFKMKPIEEDTIIEQEEF